ncbi:hypothetical protein CCZ01_07245 [Helicobacter monodelphidis]|uniref:hypothetical protein n=1 Tax=Helicobacter sp. 15-1451 TaxID=2004995 RepID=UPI000DCD9937|nr:hypothetical protein [Helicobacter sp. 15-1451]RAX57131.1 hypothetical protein CCZ01_07245 [Helicobacter sp. 15-1451]
MQSKDDSIKFFIDSTRIKVNLTNIKEEENASFKHVIERIRGVVRKEIARIQEEEATSGAELRGIYLKSFGREKAGEFIEEADNYAQSKGLITIEVLDCLFELKGLLLTKNSISIIVIKRQVVFA